MTTQMQTLSARISADDYAWLSSLDLAGAVTPSDKLRSLIAQMRKQHEGALDYTACVSWLRDLLSPLVAQIRGLEHREQMHSAALTAVIEWAPQIMATLLAARDLDQADSAAAIALERALVQQCLQLLMTLLRLGITRTSECYTADVIEKQLPRVLELADLISANRRVQKETER